MKVHWTNTAEGHLDAIFDYIAQNSPEYALARVKCICYSISLGSDPNDCAISKNGIPSVSIDFPTILRFSATVDTTIASDTPSDHKGKPFNCR